MSQYMTKATWRDVLTLTCGYKTFPGSTQLWKKFFPLINIKMPRINIGIFSSPEHKVLMSYRDRMMSVVRRQQLL